MYRLLGDLSGQRVLFVGCGTAVAQCRMLLAMGAQLWCLDVSPASLEHLMSQPWGRLRDRVHPLLASAEDTGLPEGSIDVVVGKAVLHHLDLERFRLEMRRVCRPGGKFVFSEPLKGSPLLRLFRRLTPGDRVPTEHPLSGEDLRALRCGCDLWTSRHNFLLATAGVPLMLAGWQRLGRTVFSGGHAADRAVFAAIPSARSWAWNVTFAGRLKGDD